MTSIFNVASCPHALNAAKKYKRTNATSCTPPFVPETYSFGCADLYLRLSDFLVTSSH